MGTACSVEGSFKDSIKDDQVLHLKIAIVGEPEVGKTAVFLRYIRNQFSSIYLATKKPVIENVVKKVNLPGHAMVSLTLWDIPGREDIHLYRTYFRNLDAAIVVVDLTDPASLEVASVWRQTVLNNTLHTRSATEVSHGGQIQTRTMEEIPIDKENFPILLLGNKYDIIEQKWESEKLKKMARPSSRAGQGKLPDTPVMTSIEEEEDKPESVRQLEKVAVDNQFLGSILVSASDGDGSVQAAIQSLVRHVLENKYLPRKWKPKAKKQMKHTVKKLLEFDGLEMTGDRQFDAVFKKGDISVKKVAMLTHYHQMALLKFREACFKAKTIISTENSSLEDCILGLRKAVSDVGTTLQLKEDEEFYKLVLKSTDSGVKLTKPVQSALHGFHTELAAVCKAIIKEFPMIDTNLQGLDVTISTLSDGSWDNRTGANGLPYSKQEVEKMANIIEKNRVTMRHAWTEAQAAVKAVQESKTKLKTAFMW